jgi:hypothetical protein
MKAFVARFDTRTQIALGIESLHRVVAGKPQGRANSE